MARRRKKRANQGGQRGTIKLPGGRQAKMVRESDPDGRIVEHARTVDTLERMRKSGSITPAMYDAARDFQAQFTIAGFETLHALPLVKMPGSGRAADLTDRQVDARKMVRQAMAALGGLNSPAGSCVWHVLGLQHSIRAWATHHGWGGRTVRQEPAQGMLVAGLGLLAAHYGYDRFQHHKLGS